MGKDSEIQITKSPGYDWTVDYEWEDGTRDGMEVFGVLTVEDAIREARFSLEGSRQFTPEADWLGYAILAVRRHD